MQWLLHMCGRLTVSMHGTVAGQLGHCCHATAVRSIQHQGVQQQRADHVPHFRFEVDVQHVVCRTTLHWELFTPLIMSLHMAAGPF